MSGAMQGEMAKLQQERRVQTVVEMNDGIEVQEDDPRLNSLHSLSFEGKLYVFPDKDKAENVLGRLTLGLPDEPYLVFPPGARQRASALAARLAANSQE